MSGERFRGLHIFSHASAQKTAVTEEASRRIKIGLECLFLLLSLMTEISDAANTACPSEELDPAGTSNSMNVRLTEQKSTLF